jgi:hypothetical protein
MRAFASVGLTTTSTGSWEIRAGIPSSRFGAKTEVAGPMNGTLRFWSPVNVGVKRVVPPLMSRTSICPAICGV